MDENQSFRDLLRRVRAGDQAAAAELVRVYEPAIRRAVRVRLVDERMRRVFDSTDICQSVLASFFARAALGQYELDTPEQLLKLLATMARNKLALEVRKQRTQKRDYRRQAAATFDIEQLVDASSSPSQWLLTQELLQEVARRLTDKDRALLQLRQQGYTWNEIAAQWGGNPDALRMRLERAVHEVAQQLGWDEFSDD
jgi:RNA polymerase sigma-70 factor (ECF subfamily)